MMRRFGLFAFLIAIATGCTVGPYVPPPHQEQLKPPQEQLDGVYTIQQKSNRRYVDAYPNESSDYNMVTRDWQGDDTQKWIFKWTEWLEYRTLKRDWQAGVYTIQQMSNHRYVDAYLNKSHDYSMVTRDWQGDDTQKWILFPAEEENTYIIKQKSGERYVDAYPNESSDYNMVTRNLQDDLTKPDLKELSQLGRTGHLDDTQVWIIKPAVGN